MTYKNVNGSVDKVLQLPSLVELIYQHDKIMYANFSQKCHRLINCSSISCSVIAVMHYIIVADARNYATAALVGPTSTSESGLVYACIKALLCVTLKIDRWK